MSEVLKLEMNGVGSSFTDSSASAHTITTAGTVRQVPTVFTFSNTALYFDGDSDYVSFPDSADWDITTDWSVDGWVKLTDHVGTECIIMQWQSSTQLWHFAHTHGSGLAMWIDGGAADVNMAGGEITDTDWHHWAFCKVGTACGIYLDGSQKAYQAANCTTTFAGKLQLGSATPHPSGPFYLDGHIKDARIDASNNVFSASPNANTSDTITIPTALAVTTATTKLLLNAHQPTDQKNPLCSTAWFDGDSDYLTVASSSTFNFGTGDFKIDMYMRLHTADSDFYLYDYNDTTLAIRRHTDGNLHIDIDGSSRTSYSWTPTANLWYQVTAERTGGTLYLKIDDTVVSSASNSTAISATSDILLGAHTGPNRYLSGYLKAVTVESAGTTVLDLALDGTPDDTDNTNGWLTDDSAEGHTVTANGTAACKYIEDYRNRTIVDASPSAHIATTLGGTIKLDWLVAGGSAACYFDALNSYLTVAADSDWNIGTGDFTFETWIKWKGVSPSDYIFSFGDTTANLLGAFTGGGSDWGAYALSGSLNLASGIIPVAHQWYHFALIRTGGTTTLYINGSDLANASWTDDYDGSAKALYIGTYGGGVTTYEMYGWQDELVFDNATALYTAPFIPPTYSTGAAPTSPSVSTRRVFMIT